jgi:phosphoglycerol transferase MdoB-like AlkP superfamily enzyme
MYCSMVDRLSKKWICAHNQNLNLLSFPGILRSRGFETIYVHGGENSFGSHDNRLGEWFERVYDRHDVPLRDHPMVGWGLRDKDLYASTLKILRSRTDKKRPFFLAIATLSLHFPMLLPDPRYEFLPHTTYDNRVSNILRYADDALGDFIEEIQRDPEFKNTIVLVAADHGLMGRVPDSASEIVTWIPIALIGKGWNIPPQRIAEIRQSLDIAPTILDRLGIEVPNPFLGQSLLRRFRGRDARVFSGTANDGVSASTRLGDFRYRLDLKTGR